MQQEYFISLWLDERRPKSNGKYPVKLRVFTPSPRKQKLYNTKFEFTTVNEFNSIWKTVKPRIKYEDIRNEMDSVVEHAKEIAKEIAPFDFNLFNKKLLRNVGDGANVIYQYKQVISKLKQDGQIGTASNYDLSLKSLLNFINKDKPEGTITNKLMFSVITKDWLQKYENFMVKEKEKSFTTVSIYLRALRTIFNKAIKDNEIKKELYPFGKDRYELPSVSNVKKALNKVELKKLFDSIPQTPQQAKAKDFWFFSYTCNGMNIKDIALLKYKDLEKDKFIFYRAKTMRTSKTKLKPVTVYLNNFSEEIIKKRGNEFKTKNDYIFPIINSNDTESEKHNKIKNFTKFINQNLKKLAIAEGLTEDISTYWARHSYATNSIRNGASMAFMMEALSHNDMKTTQNYFAGFEDEAKKEFSKGLMNFE